MCRLDIDQLTGLNSMELHHTHSKTHTRTLALADHGEGGNAALDGVGDGTADDGDQAGGEQNVEEGVGTKKMQFFRGKQAHVWISSPVDSTPVEEDNQTSMIGMTSDLTEFIDACRHLDADKGIVGMEDESTRFPNPLFHVGRARRLGPVDVVEEGDDVPSGNDGSLMVVCASSSNLGFCGIETPPVGKTTTTRISTTRYEGSGLRRDGRRDPMEKYATLKLLDGSSMLWFEGDMHGAVNGGDENSLTPADLNVAEFLKLAYRVLDGDVSSMAALKELQNCWEHKFDRHSMQTDMVALTGEIHIPPDQRATAPLIDSQFFDDPDSPAMGPATNTERRRLIVDVDSMVADHGAVNVEEVHVDGDGSDDLACEVKGDMANFGATTTADGAVQVAKGVLHAVDEVEILRDVASKSSISDTVQTQPTGLFVGNILLHTCPEPIVDDKIAYAFNNSSRKTFSYIAPTIQNGEVIVRPTLESIQTGSRRWRSTAVGYFLDKRPYFHHLKEYAKSVWLALREGQPIVLQKWEPVMVKRKLKHTQVLVWIRLHHLPVELWIEEGLSTVASGVGKPLYLDAITRACTRLDFARVCVMLDISSKLPKHIIMMTPDEDGGEAL
ncbi:UNVERIFIED_CONTAM: hypothetical protein Sindi_2703300 [Sesamum indicum]